MKKSLIFRSAILLIFFVLSRLVISQDTTFQTVIGGTDDETYPRIINAGNNEFLILNRTLSNSFGDIDIMLTKINSLGVPLWTRNIGNTNRNFSKTIHKTDDGFLVLAWHGEYSAIDDWCLIKLDHNGNIVGHKFYGMSGIDEEVHNMILLANGNYVVAAALRESVTSPMITFLDPNLNIIESILFEVSNTWLVRGLTQTNTGEIILSGSHNSKPGFLSINESGEFNFMKYLNFTGFTEVRHIIPADENSVIAVGFTNYQSGSYDILVVKLSNSGELIWAKKYGESGDEKAYDIKRKTDSTFLVSGETSSFGKSKEAFLINIDQDGNFISGNLYGTDGIEQFAFFDFTDDRKIMLVTETDNPESASSDLLIVKADEDGISCDSRVIESIAESNLTENLISLYPNIVDDYRMKTTHAFSIMTWEPFKTDLCVEEIPADTTTLPVDTIPQNYLSCNVKIVNVITPNNDGQGDYVSAIYEKEISHFEFKAYNIMGELLFKTYDPHFKWNGKVNGSTLPNGTYIYTCEYLCPEQQGFSHDWGKIILTR